MSWSSDDAGQPTWMRPFSPNQTPIVPGATFMSSGQLLVQLYGPGAADVPLASKQLLGFCARGRRSGVNESAKETVG